MSDDQEQELSKAIGTLVDVLNSLDPLKSIELLTAEELGQKFKVPKSRIYYLANMHGLPFIQWSDNQKRFDPLAVRRWLDNGGWQQMGADESTGLRDVSAPS